LRLPVAFRQASLWSSPLARAAETAAIVGEGAPRIESALIEMSWGAWEGCQGRELLGDGQSGYRHIEEWGWDFQPPGGETPRMVWDRLSPWLATLRGNNVAVTHVGVMRVILARACGWDFCGPAPFKVKRDRLYRIVLHRSGGLQFDGEPVRLVPAQ
jgi:probable phosphoglycerate mutase